MPVTITRTAEVYRLWDDTDLRALFDSHAQAGWLCTLSAFPQDSVVVWQVQLQLSSNRQLVIGGLADVIVSDTVTVQAMSLAEYNAANPDHAIEEFGS